MCRSSTPKYSRELRYLLSCETAISSPAHWPSLIGSDIDVEETVRLRRHVRDSSAVGRKHRIGVDEFVVGQRSRFTGRDVDDGQLNRRPAIVSRVDDPVAVRRPVGHRVIFPVVGDLMSDAARGIDFPDRAAHRNGYPFAVRRPGRRPRRRARRRRQIVVVHVIAAGSGARVRARRLARQRPKTPLRSIRWPRSRRAREAARTWTCIYTPCFMYFATAATARSTSAIVL